MNFDGLKATASGFGKPGWVPVLEYVADLRGRSVFPARGVLPYEWENIGPGYCYGPAFGHWDLIHAVMRGPAWNSSRKVIRTIPTGKGTCGLTMSNDERYVIASNDDDDSISVIDTETDAVVNTVSARKGFEALGLTGYIQGSSDRTDDAIHVYGCSGNGALVRFTDVAGEGAYVISYGGGTYASPASRQPGSPRKGSSGS